MNETDAKKEHQGEITSEIFRLSHIHENLIDSIGKLESRLEGALRQPDPESKSEEEDARPNTSIGSAIRTEVTRAEEAVHRVESLIKRLEL